MQLPRLKPFVFHHWPVGVIIKTKTELFTQFWLFLEPAVFCERVDILSDNKMIEDSDINKF